MAKEKDVLKVLTALEKRQAEAGWSWLGQIAKLTGLHHETVRRIIDGCLFEAIEEFDAEPLIGEGLKNKQIAERLCISEPTVRHYLTSIFDKVGVTGRLGLIIYAYQHGLAKLPDIDQNPQNNADMNGHK